MLEIKSNEFRLKSGSYYYRKSVCFLVANADKDAMVAVYLVKRATQAHPHHHQHLHYIVRKSAHNEKYPFINLIKRELCAAGSEELLIRITEERDTFQGFNEYNLK